MLGGIHGATRLISRALHIADVGGRRVAVTQKEQQIMQCATRCAPWLALCIGSQQIACGASSQPSVATRQTPSSTSAAAPAKPPPVVSIAVSGLQLEAKTPIEREIHGGEIHTYNLMVPADRVFAGTIEQRGIDLEVRVINPEGKLVATIDSPNGPSGPEPWLIEPKPAGLWRLEVKPFEPAATGKYEARIDETITMAEYDERRAKSRYRSARMLRLWKELRQDKAAAVEHFAKEITDHAPLVEPIAGDPRGDMLVTFVFQGDADTHYVGLMGGPIGPEMEHAMIRFEDSNLWYLSARVPKNLRIAYAFRVGDPPDFGVSVKEKMAAMFAVRPDPWNPQQTLGRSLVELPDAPAQPWAERKAGVATGRIVEKTMRSEALKTDYKLGVYLPAKFDPKGGPYPFVIAFDGEVYGHSPQSIVPTPTILDNLIAEGKVPLMLAILLDSADTRMRDLAMSSTFCDFLAKDIVPWLRSEHHASKKPAEATLAGSSLGGLASAYCAFHHPDVFGNVLSQSGSYWFTPGAMGTESQYALETGAMMREVIAAPKKPLRVWMEVGLFEGGGGLPGSSMVAQNRHMRDVLLLKGYEVSYHEFAGGHDYASWRGSLADGLMFLAGKAEKR